MPIELSYTLSEEIPRWPSNPPERRESELSTARGDVCNAGNVFHHLHNGTHVDAPRHFDPAGKTICDIPIGDFYYTSPYVLRVPKKKGERIELDDLLSHSAEISRCDILFLYTGFCEFRNGNPAKYIDGFPWIAPEAAGYLRKELPRLKAVALDTISVDDGVSGKDLGFPAHHALLCGGEFRPLLIYEDVNIRPLLNAEDVKCVCAFPVRWKGMEAAPVGMVAL